MTGIEKGKRCFGPRPGIRVGGRRVIDSLLSEDAQELRQLCQGLRLGVAAVDAVPLFFALSVLGGFLHGLPFGVFVAEGRQLLGFERACVAQVIETLLEK